MCHSIIYAATFMKLDVTFNFTYLCYVPGHVLFSILCLLDTNCVSSLQEVSTTASSLAPTYVQKVMSGLENRRQVVLFTIQLTLGRFRPSPYHILTVDIVSTKIVTYHQIITVSRCFRKEYCLIYLKYYRCSK